MEGSTLDIVLLLFYGLVAPIAAIVAAAVAGKGHRLKWAGICFLLPFALAWLVARRGRGADVDGPKGMPRAAPEPVPTPGEADVAGLRAPFSACPDCGFLGVRPPGVQDGVWPGGGELVAMVCPRCDFRGLPVYFDGGDEYREYVADLRRAGPSA